MKTRIAMLVAAAAATATAPAAFAGPTLEKVVAASDPLVGGASGEIWRLNSLGAFGVPSIDSAGNVAFSATLAGTGVTTANDLAYYYGGPMSLGMVVREGNPASPPLNGIGAATFVSRQKVDVPMSPNGKMWIGGTFTGGTSNRAFFVGPASGLDVHSAQLGDASWVAPGITYSATTSPDSTSGTNAQVNNAGQSYTFAGITGPGVTVGVNDSAIGYGAPGAVSLVVRRGDSLPGAGMGGETVTSLGSPHANGNGKLVMIGGLATSGAVPATTSNDGIIMSNVSGSTSVIAREGGATGVAGLSFGVSTSTFFPLFSPARQALNNNNKYMYLAPVAGAGVTAGVNDTAVFVHDGTSNSLFRQRGDMAPGYAGKTINTISPNDMTLNNNDSVLWTAKILDPGGVTTANDGLLYMSQLGGSDTAIFREGNAAPGLPGVFLGEALNPIMNNLGQIVFTTVLSGAGVTTANDRSIWTWDAVGGLCLVLREGDAPFGFPVTSFTYSGNANSEGGYTSLTDSNWFTFSINEGTGTGSTLNSAVVRTLIPSPGTLALLGMGALVAGRRRR